MKSSSEHSEHDEQDQKIIRLLKQLGSFQAEYSSELLSVRRAAFVAKLEQMRPAEAGEEMSEGDEAVVKLLENLKPAREEYPAELLSSRRAAFLAQVEQLSPAEVGEELPAGAEEVVRRLGALKSAPVEYPPELLAARRSAFLRQARGAGETSLLDRLRASLRRIIPYPAAIPASPSPGVMRLSLVLASLLLAVLVGSLLFSRTELSASLPPSQTSAASTLLPPGSGDMALTICTPGDRTPACSPEDLTPERDLANVGNGSARPAVSRDGREGESWVSQSPGGWIKIDLGQVTSINTVSLQKGSPGSGGGDDLGQFVIAVALSDVYSDGDS
ncbi:MAG TPA: hypothetical protein VK900_12170, partial [Anaerolineales bacterium]|nr:hypothetical protein [Anaerolineales bacterium]